MMSVQPFFIAFSDNPADASEYETLLASESEIKFDARNSPDDFACVLYTSGTTGRPKGAKLTHRGLLGNCAASIDEALHFRDSDVALAPMPFFHVGGMWYHLFPCFAAGCTTVILPEFNPNEVLRLIERYKVSNVHL